MKKLPSKLHEADEPLPWADKQVFGQLVGSQVDELMMAMFGRPADTGIMRCDTCGRWQEFPPPYRFGAMRERAQEAGWRRDGDNDLCPICVGN